MPNVLEVQIVGDVSNLEKSLKQAEKLQAEYTQSIERTSKELADNITVTRGYAKAIDDLNKEYKDGSISSKDYSKQLANLKRDEKESAVATNDLRKELANLKKEQKEVGNSFDGASKKVANGGNALMQFSRIAQDAPFGIAGIGNNITATAEAFGHLQKQTGSTGAALKAVAGSILGSGGILLAVSLVTTGLTYMAQQGISVEDVFDKLTGTFDENASALKKASIEGAKAASEEIISLNALASVAQNENLTRKERLIAVEKLQSAYPAYFGNLSKEAILTGDITTVVNELTKALIQKSIAEKLSSDSADIQLKIFEANAKLLNAKNKTSELEIKLAKDLAEAQKSVGNSAAQLATIRAKGVNSINDSKEAEQEARNEIIKGNAALKQRQDIINRLTAASIKTGASAPKTAGGDEIDLTPKVTALPSLSTTAEVAKSYLKEFQKVFGDVLNNKIEPIELTIPPVVIPAVDDSEYRASLARAKVAGEVFANGTNAVIGALGSELASSLETGNAAVDAFTGSIIQSLADIAAAQLAGLIAKQAFAAVSLSTDAAVATGNSVVAATETAAASGPAAAFVLPALVGAAIGFIAASFAGIKFAHGGIVPGGSYTGDKIPAMLNSGEAVMNSQQQANTLMAIANGNSNSLQGNRQNSNFTLESKLRGTDILLSVKREERKR